MVEYKVAYAAYRVGSDGSIWTVYVRGSKDVRSHLWRELSQYSDRDGYRRVSLWNGYKWIVERVHHLVLKAFKGLRPNGKMCRHLDGDPSNNELSNLEWGTSIQNWEDKRKHGRATSKEKNGRAKLTSEDVKAIRALSSTHTRKALAEIYGVNPSNIGHIVLGRTWT